MSELTREELAAFRAAEARATAGKWHVNEIYPHISDRKGSVNSSGERVYGNTRYVEGPIEVVCETGVHTRDVELIALMRNNWLRLIAAAERGIPAKTTQTLPPCSTADLTFHRTIETDNDD
jgi:hypothetical protein